MRGSIRLAAHCRKVPVNSDVSPHVKTELPAWLAPIVAPILIFVTVISAVMKILDYAAPKYALVVAVSATLVAVAWVRDVWSDRAEPSVYGSTVKPFRYSRLVRYVALLAVAFCFVATTTLVVVQLKSATTVTERPRIAEMPFRILNGFSTQIWIPEAGELQVLASTTPAVDTVIATTRVRVDMPGVFKFGGRPQVDPNSEARGILKLPSRSEPRRKSRRLVGVSQTNISDSANWR